MVLYRGPWGDVGSVAAAAGHFVIPQLGFALGVLTKFQYYRWAVPACPRPGFLGGTAPPGFLGPPELGSWPKIPQSKNSLGAFSCKKNALACIVVKKCFSRCQLSNGKYQIPNVKCQNSNVNYQMSNVKDVKTHNMSKMSNIKCQSCQMPNVKC